MKVTRRSALFTALSASRVPGANERVRVAGIGVGGRAKSLLDRVARLPNTQLVAVADVYQPRLNEFMQCATTSDYRRLLDLKNVDAVVIGAPDHWHVRMVLDALAAGKDVYVEKPLTRTIDEGDLMLKAFESTKQIVQVGYQQRSTDTFLRAKERLDAGAIGQVTMALTYWYQNYNTRTPDTIQADPAKLDWKAWLGSAPEQPFDKVRFRLWRWFWDFGGGTLTDLFSHWVDSVHWLLGEDKPNLVMASGSVYRNKHFQCPDTVSGSWRYSKFLVSYESTLISGLEDGGIVFRGTEGMMKVNRAFTTIYPEKGARWDRLPEPTFHYKAESDGTTAHIANWLDCVRSRKMPNSNIRDAVASARTAHWGNQSIREEKAVRPGA
ncbi:MAG TPA: Gfo/Idh/MocA family oxidoreductase [Bryobacteraceae bacterium]|nr:Gfo/Idh/MocA family oxidoreductase [Bryobacteraceae bacterium]